MVIQKSGVKAIIRANGKRAKPEFFAELDRLVTQKVEQACRVHNGGKVTLDTFICAHVFGKTSL